MRFLATTLLCALLAAGCAAELHRPTAGPCRTPNAAQLLRDANRSLTFVDFAPGPGYDTGAHGEARPLRLRAIAPGSKAVLSYPDPERFAGADAGFALLSRRTFVYDQALAMVWAVQHGDRPLARALGQTLAALQNPDGSWGFSFAAHGDGYYNANYVRAGAAAWCAYGLALYLQGGADDALQATLDRSLAWLVGQVDPTTKLVRAGHGRWHDGDHFDPDWPADFAATEHQIDAWFALMAAAAVPGVAQAAEWRNIANQLAAAVDARLWRAGE
ncbi:MAG: hypothetical protein HY902_20245, partial [Deltaproteobacteria bacterium]|nr:hypothetical protein [Deltaproteobacteria bacterium]